LIEVLVTAYDVTIPCNEPIAVELFAFALIRIDFPSAFSGEDCFDCFHVGWLLIKFIKSL
jgi:hypothetical protein